jgi:uncharacterized protein YjbJ (UPF0337 family)
MNVNSKHDWLIAEALADETECFVLWMIGSKLCATRADFQRHFESDVPADDLIDDLKHRGFVAERGLGLNLTELGQLTIRMLQQRATTTGQKESLDGQHRSESSATSDVNEAGESTQAKHIVADHERASSRDRNFNRSKLAAMSTPDGSGTYRGTDSMINAQVLQGQWNKLRGQVQQKWGVLTDDDLAFANGNVDQLVGRIQQRTGEARQAIENYLDDLSSRGGAAVAQAADRVRDYASYASRLAYDESSRISDVMGRGYEESQDLIRANPTRSVAAAFGAGVVVGIVIGLALTSR